MFLYEKKIVYLSYYLEGVKRSSAGFARISRERDACLLEVHIKNVPDMAEGDYALFLVLKNREIQWGTISALKSRADIGKRIPMRNEIGHIGEEAFNEDMLCGILIHLNGKAWIAGYWKQPDVMHGTEKKQGAAGTETAHAIADGREKNKTAQTAKSRDLHAAGEVPQVEQRDEKSRAGELKMKEAVDEGTDKIWGGIRADILPLSEKKEILVEPASEDKWEQLQKNYRRVHPFGDDRLFLSIEPRDFVILQASYQKLVNNSFLLHGYYNYRHLILGPDAEIGGSDRDCFYLGVPGTYFEREKMVAVMFGFEGFECSGPVEIGKFGYYMRRVEL